MGPSFFFVLQEIARKMDCFAALAMTVRQLNQSTRRANHFRLAEIESSPARKKYFCFPEVKNGLYAQPSRSNQRGRFANVTDVGTGCGGRGGARDGRVGCGWRSRVVPTPQRLVSSSRSRAGNGGKSAGLTEESTYKPSTIAQGKPDASASPVCSCAAYLYPIAHETAGAARTRLSLRPLISRAKEIRWQTSGAWRREIAKLRLLI